jgi:hypothetical protein
VHSLPTVLAIAAGAVLGGMCGYKAVADWANPDHGIGGFKRYVALAVVARNLQRLGAVLRGQEAEAARRKRGPYKKAA